MACAAVGVEPTETSSIGRPAARRSLAAVAASRSPSWRAMSSTRPSSRRGSRGPACVKTPRSRRPGQRPRRRRPTATARSGSDADAAVPDVDLQEDVERPAGVVEGPGQGGAPSTLSTPTARRTRSASASSRRPLSSPDDGVGDEEVVEAGVGKDLRLADLRDGEPPRARGALEAGDLRGTCGSWRGDGAGRPPRGPSRPFGRCCARARRGRRGPPVSRGRRGSCRSRAQGYHRSAGPGARSRRRFRRPGSPVLTTVVLATTGGSAGFAGSEAAGEMVHADHATDSSGAFT